jgi:Domain of unknown function (DUF4394)
MPLPQRPSRRPAPARARQAPSQPLKGQERRLARQPRAKAVVVMLVACGLLSACGTRWWPRQASTDVPFVRTAVAPAAPAVTAPVPPAVPSAMPVMTQVDMSITRQGYKEELVAVTASQHLVRFSASYPARLSLRQRLSGLPDGETVADVDYRVAKGVLFGVSNQGRVITIDPWTARVTVVSESTPAISWGGQRAAIDFNPAVDRIRVVTSGGMNLRMHPDTGKLIDSNPNEGGVQIDRRLAYVAGDVNAGRLAEVTAVGYTYNKDNEKVTTLFGIDRAQGTLVRHGSLEGQQPFVSPDTGELRTVGALGLGPLVDVSMDISDLRYLALAAVRTQAEPRSVLYDIDLRNGQPRRLGVIGDGEPVLGLAIVP